MVTDLIIPMPHEAENRPARFASLASRIDRSVLRHIVVADNDATDCYIGQALKLDPTRAIRFDATKSLVMPGRICGRTMRIQMKAALPGWSVGLINVPSRMRCASNSRTIGGLVDTVRGDTTTTIGTLWWYRPAITSAARVHHAAR